MNDHRLTAFAHLFGEKYGNELPLAPQIAGRDRYVERGGIDAGKIFAPEHPLWGNLLSVKMVEVICSCVMRLNLPNKLGVCKFILMMCN
jgi:hypothetical protein